MWPTDLAVKELTATEEGKIVELLKKARSLRIAAGGDQLAEVARGRRDKPLRPRT